MTSPERYDLYGIASILYRQKKLIILITLLAGIAGVLFALVRTKKYQAETQFFLKNPFYADRNFLFNQDTKFIDYFAAEDDVNRLLSLATSDSVQSKVIRKFNLTRAYKANTTDPRHMVLLRQSVAGALKIQRTSNKTVTLKYTDKDPKRAAAIANYMVEILEQELRGFYNTTRLQMYASIMTKVREQDSMVNALTDTLVALREKHGIYNLVNPTRANLILSDIKPTGKPGFAEGLEEIQNISSLKDNAVSNRAWHLSLAQQYTAGTKWNELPLTKMISIADTPIKPAGPGKTLTAIIAAMLGFTFAVLYVLVTNGAKRLG